MKRVWEELEEATEVLLSAVATLSNTVEELWEECRGVVVELKDEIGRASCRERV